MQYLLNFLRPKCNLCHRMVKWTETRNVDNQACETNCGHVFHVGCITQKFIDPLQSYFCCFPKCNSRLIFLHGPGVHRIYKTTEYKLRTHLCFDCKAFVNCYAKLATDDEKSMCYCPYYHCDLRPVPKVKCPWRNQARKGGNLSLFFSSLLHVMIM
jgi:hypothetical protein